MPEVYQELPGAASGLSLSSAIFAMMGPHLCYLRGYNNASSCPVLWSSPPLSEPCWMSSAAPESPKQIHPLMPSLFPITHLSALLHFSSFALFALFHTALPNLMTWAGIITPSSQWGKGTTAKRFTTLYSKWKNYRVAASPVANSLMPLWFSFSR